MSDAYRKSPVRFDAEAEETQERDGWSVVLAFGDEGPGPWLTDLSHRRRWDCQAADLSAKRLFGFEVPGTPGDVSIHGDMVINRMNRTQAAMWHLGSGNPPATPDDPSVTELTDAHCMLAVVGPGTRSALECVTNLDLIPPGRPAPFLTQGPVLRIPCQVVTLGSECVVMTFARGYGQSFSEAWLHAAAPSGIRPAGERAFTGRFRRRSSRRSRPRSGPSRRR